MPNVIKYSLFLLADLLLDASSISAIAPLRFKGAQRCKNGGAAAPIAERFSALPCAHEKRKCSAPYSVSARLINTTTK